MVLIFTSGNVWWICLGMLHSQSNYNNNPFQGRLLMSITCLNKGEHYFHLSVSCHRKPELSWVRDSLEGSQNFQPVSLPQPVPPSSLLTYKLPHLCLPRCLHSAVSSPFPPLSSYPVCFKNNGLVQWTTLLLECLLFDGNCNTGLYLRNDSSGENFPETFLAEYLYDGFSVMLSHLQTAVTFIEHFPCARHHSSDAIAPSEGKHYSPI